MKKIFFLTLCMIFFIKCHADPQIFIHEKKILELFFHNMMQETEAGYVLLGKKPTCTMGMDIDHSVAPFIQNHKLGIALWKGIKIWQKIEPKDSNIIIRQYDKANGGIVIINKSLLLKTVEENLPLFQYVLGPTVTPQKILDNLLTEDKIFSCIHCDKVLSGIILGYGVKNSLYGSRFEDIQETLLYLDHPPYQNIMKKLPNTAHLYKNFLLRNPFYSKDCSNVFLNFNLRFANIGEEFQNLIQNFALSSPLLVEQKPQFIFGRIKNDHETDELIANLEKTQKELQEILQSSNFFTIVMEKIFEKPFSFSELKEKTTEYDQKYDEQFLLAKGIWNYFQSMQASESDAIHFLQGFSSEKKLNRILKAPMQLNKQTFLQAKANIENSNQFFASLANNSSLKCIVPHLLYYQILQEGKGDPLNKQTKIFVEMEVFDPANKRIHYTHAPVSMNLTETISGFAHGIQGMKKEEIREIYVHPSLAYGVHTFLEKGIPLRFVVKLLDIELDSSGTLPKLDPIDLSYFSNPQFFKECEEAWTSEAQISGWELKELLKQFPKVEIEVIKEYLTNFLKKNKNQELTNEEKEALLGFYWQEYFDQA